MITPDQSRHVYQLLKFPAARLAASHGHQQTVTGPTHGGQTLADKLQRLVLEQPRVATQIERLVDVFLTNGGGQ